SGRIELGLLGLPIEIIPAIGHLGFNGDLRGVISIRRTDGITAVDGVVPLDNFRVSGHPLGQTLVNLRSDIGQLVVGAKLIDGGAEVDLEGHLPVEWQHLLPSRRQQVPIRLAATAKGYDAGVLGPWLGEYVTDLAGELDGNLEATYFTLLDQDGTGTPNFAIGGRLALRNGSAVVLALGQKLSGISFDAQATSTGSRTTLTVPHVSASVGNTDGRVSGSMLIELDALKLKRLAARIDRADSVPVSINSVDLATVSASANIEVQPSSKGYDVDTQFDNLDVKLPRVAGRQVVGLSEHPEITTVQPLGSAAWKQARTRQGTLIRFQVDLGKKARISRSDFNLPVTGTLSVELADRMRPSGAVQLEPLGRLQLFGKVFVIDHGRVTFDPDQPSNPRLDVTGSWRGPTHVVTVQIQGTREEARLRWSSDPPLTSESQVLALLLGGGSGDDSTASAGLGVGATLFHEVLSQTALSSLEVRTSADERHANYTAAMPLRENLWFEATYQSPTNTSLPGSSAQRGFSGTVDYRFRRNWSVRTEVGTLGAGADLLWQYRY
ncbi:MAG TPA: translocation/assembly module TamB domain-containing protein, partial [Polyangiaceae bacterium]